MRRIFLDASCWVAVAGSPDGGSAKILIMGQAGKLKVLASPRVLEEAERNIGRKLGPEALARFYRILADTPIEQVENSTEEEDAIRAKLIPEKDRHVLAAAFKSQASVLVSLDRRHVLSDRVRYGFPIPVRSTKEFVDEFEIEND